MMYDDAAYMNQQQQQLTVVLSVYRPAASLRLAAIAATQIFYTDVRVTLINNLTSSRLRSVYSIYCQYVSRLHSCCT